MNKVTFALVAVAIFSSIMALSFATVAKSSEPVIGPNSVTVLLNYKRIPAGDFIYLYDSSPHPIADGHLAVKVDCDEQGNTPIAVVVGVAPDLHVIRLTHEDNMVHELSVHGEMCIYHMHLPPEHNMEVTDVAIINTGDRPFRLGPTAMALIHVHSYGEPVAHHNGKHANSGGH